MATVNLCQIPILLQAVQLHKKRQRSSKSSNSSLRNKLMHNQLITHQSIYQLNRDIFILVHAKLLLNIQSFYMKFVKERN